MSAIYVMEPEETALTPVNAGDFGLDPSRPDNSAALQALLDRFAGKSRLRIVFPAGTYRFAGEAPLFFRRMEHVLVDGQGSEFVFRTPEYFRFEHCRRIAVKNLIVDWDWDACRLADLGRIRSCGEHCFDIEYLEVDHADPALPWEQVNQFDPQTLTPGVPGGRLFVFDTCVVDRVEQTGDDRVLRVYPRPGSFEGLEAGQVYLVRHYGYHRAVFDVFSCRHILFEDVTIYSAYGAGFYIAGDTGHYRLNRCVIGLRPGAARRISTTVDAFHVAQSQGHCVIEHCDFSFMGDDAVNIHDTIGLVEARESDRALRVQSAPPFEPGDLCVLKNSDFDGRDAALTVAAAEPAENGRHILSFTADIPAFVDDRYIVANARYDSSHYVIRDNAFHENRSRALLLQSSHGLVENNRFYKTQGPPVYIMMEIMRDLWYEGSGARDIRIRGNTFDSCNVMDWFSLIDIRCELFSDWEMACVPALQRREPVRRYPVFEDIRVEDNRFIDVPGYLMYIYAAAHVAIENNRITQTAARPHSHPFRGEIAVWSSNHIAIRGNRYEPSPHMARPFHPNAHDSGELHYDDGTAV